MVGDDPHYRDLIKPRRQGDPCGGGASNTGPNHVSKNTNRSWVTTDGLVRWYGSPLGGIGTGSSLLVAIAVLFSRLTPQLVVAPAPDPSFQCEASCLTRASSALSARGRSYRSDRNFFPITFLGYKRKQIILLRIGF